MRHSFPSRRRLPRETRPTAGAGNQQKQEAVHPKAQRRPLWLLSAYNSRWRRQRFPFFGTDLTPVSSFELREVAVGGEGLWHV